jgi:uracil-DNA glycosylase family 4
MSDYRALLDSTEAYLRALKNRGLLHLPVRGETLAALARPLPPQKAAPATPSAQTAVVQTPATPQTPAKPTPAPMPIAIMPAQTKEDAIREIRDRALACVKCPNLASSRKNVVFGVGDIHAPLLFVGEAPGADEDAQGEPFVGAAGELLTKIIRTMGFSRETVYIANVLKCRPDTPGQAYGNRKPTPDEMKTCLPYLLAQIEVIRPKVMVALGATAIEGLLGRAESVGKLRGKFLSFRDIPLMPTYHPAYLLRNQALSEKRKLWEDMLQVLERLEAPISEKQRGYFLPAPSPANQGEMAARA